MLIKELRSPAGLGCTAYLKTSSQTRLHIINLTITFLQIHAKVKQVRKNKITVKNVANVLCFHLKDCLKSGSQIADEKVRLSWGYLFERPSVSPGS